MTDTAVQQLREIREQWGDLLAAINRPPAAEWPPRELHHQLDAADAEPQCTACNDTGACAGGPCALAMPRVGRLPLVLRQHPAPANLTALDAALDIEHGLFDLADRIAAAVQRPVRNVPWPNLGTRVLWAYEPADLTHPDRWHTATIRALQSASAGSAGSRALGLHWCGCWIEDRLAQTERTDLHDAVRGVLRDHAADIIGQSHRALARALGRDGRTTPLTDPCPWCHGELTARTTSGDPAAARITCSTGPTCTAPAPYDSDARRTWHGRDLVQLYGALTAARSKEAAA